MTTKDILKIVKEAFNEMIDSSVNETLNGLCSRIEGRSAFFAELEKRLNEKF